MLSKDLEASLNQALFSAQKRSHEYATVEHLLLALLDNPEVSSTLRSCGCDLQILAKDLEEYLASQSASLSRTEKNSRIVPTIAFQRVIQRAVYQVHSAGKQLVTGNNVLVAIYAEKDSHAAHFLRKQEVNRLDILSVISHQTQDDPAPTPPMPEPEHPSDDSSMDGDNGKMGKKEVDPVTGFANNLNEKAKQGRIDPLIGRADELTRIMQVLCRRRKNNPLLVGEAGVGKTHLAEGLALRIVEGQVPEVLQEAVVYALDMGNLLAGTKFRGDFEARMKGLLKGLKREKFPILLIDEIHTVIGTGATSGSSLDASNLLKPLLASGEMRCIGSTTYEEYRGIFEKDRALARRFQKVDINEPNREETIEIVKGLKHRYEEYHGIRYTLAAIISAVELSGRHITDRKHPDSAIDVIDEAGAAVQLMPLAKRRKSIGVREVEEVVSRMARIPARSVSRSDRDVLLNLDKNLRLVLFGQEDAVAQVCQSIRLSRAGLSRPEKPIGSFLFTGPTGVGKTELARQLAREMNVELIRFDMSEYMERHTVSRLIGAPPGYVGFDQGGLLTDAIHKHPHAVLLLDEIEKAHPDVFNLLLQVMDHGKLTDNNGRQTIFTNVILIMTTNAGAQDRSRASIGFTTQDHVGDEMKEIKRLFSPEFRNRLDAIIPFAALTRESILRVVDKFLLVLESQLEEKRVILHISDEARSWLADRGYDHTFGARPMDRLIQNHLRKPLAEEILFGRLLNGGDVTIRVDEDQLVFEYESGKGRQTNQHSAEPRNQSDFPNNDTEFV